jgi:hypothetical protein
MMLNEYTDMLIECMEIPANKMGHCDPLGDANFPEGLWESIAMLAIVTAICMAISLWIMKVLSHRAY